MLDPIDSEQRYERKRTDTVPGFVEDLSDVLLCKNCSQAEYDASRIILVLQSAAFDAEMFRSNIKFRVM